VKTARVRSKIAATTRGHKATIAARRPTIVGRVRLIIAVATIIRLVKVLAVRVRRVPPGLGATIVPLVKDKAAVMAIARKVRAVIKAVKVRVAVTAIVRKAKVRAAVTAIARKVGKAAAIKAAALVPRAGRAVVLRRLAGRVR